MTTVDDQIRAFLADEARRAAAAAPSFDEAVGRLAPRIEVRPSGASQRLIVLLAATLLLVAALGTAIAVGSGILRLPLVIDDPTISGGMWPQTSLEEVRQAQELADAGDPAYTWQVDEGLRDWHSVGLEESLGDAEIVARFLREELGWEAFQYHAIPEDGFGDGIHSNAAYIRCAPGRRNPLYPSDPDGCAPTIDDVHYERVSLDLGQLVRQDASGMWVVTRWAMLPPFEQVVPPSGAETTTVLEAFLQARIDGAGAEEHVDALPDEGSPTAEVPLLYATTNGAPYERSEFEVVDSPVWPDGWVQFKVRLFAEGGEMVVEQLFFMTRDETGRLRLEYRSGDLGIAPTTENGQAVPVRYSFLDGEVTFDATWPWEYNAAPTMTTLSLDTNNQGGLQVGLTLVADARPVGPGCQEGPAPTDADALARSIRSDPDLEATAPVAVSVGGAPALQMDIVVATGAGDCTWEVPGEVWTSPLVLTETPLIGGERMRLYLVDLAGGSARILAIAITTPGSSFERGFEAAAPLVDSVEFHAP